MRAEEGKTIKNAKKRPFLSLFVHPSLPTGPVGTRALGSLFTRHFLSGWSCLTGGLMRYYVVCEGNIACFPHVLHPVPVFLWVAPAFTIYEFGEEVTT